jgi:hypothetical protein
MVVPHHLFGMTNSCEHRVLIVDWLVCFGSRNMCDVLVYLNKVTEACKVQ